MCGRADVDQFLDELTFTQIDELCEYLDIEGTQQQRDDARWAWGMAVLCRKIGVEASPEDFMAYHADSQPKQASPEAQRLANLINTRSERM